MFLFIFDRFEGARYNGTTIEYSVEVKDPETISSSEIGERQPLLVKKYLESKIRWIAGSNIEKKAAPFIEEANPQGDPFRVICEFHSCSRIV